MSWGKIRMTARPVKVCADATLVFPLIVAETFARTYHQEIREKRDAALHFAELNEPTQDGQR